MTRAGKTATRIWALTALVAAVIAIRASYTTDLSAFLPRRASATQTLLVEQLREGPAAHLIIAAIAGADTETRAAVSRQMALRLRTDPAFLSIDNGNAAELERDREFIFEHRYLLSPRVSPELFTAGGLHAAIRGSLDTLILCRPPGETAVSPRPHSRDTGHHRIARCESCPAHRRGRVELARWHARSDP